MIKHITDQELMALSLHHLTALECQLRDLLETIDPASSDATTIHSMLNRIARVRTSKRRRRPLP